MPGFTNVRDECSAPFYLSRMPRFRTADETADEVVHRFSEVVFETIASAMRRPLRMSTEQLLRWHRAIFGTTFPDAAGRLRDDGVTFGIRWRESGAPQRAMAHGAPLSRLRSALDRAFAAYHAELDRCGPDGRTRSEAAFVAGGLHAELLRIHPFPDGNLRACFPVLQGALISLGGAGVEFDGALEAHDEALGWALRPDDDQRTLEPFAALLVERMRTSRLVLPMPIESTDR